MPNSGPPSPGGPAVLLLVAGIGILAGMFWWATSFLPFLRGGQAATATVVEVQPAKAMGSHGFVAYRFLDPAGQEHEGRYSWPGGKNSYNRLRPGDAVPVWFLTDAPDRCYFGEAHMQLRRCLLGAAVGALMAGVAGAALWSHWRPPKGRVVVVSTGWWVIQTVKTGSGKQTTSPE